MRNQDNLFHDYEIMTVACFVSALLYMMLEQYNAACGQVLGFSVGISIYHSILVYGAKLTDVNQVAPLLKRTQARSIKAA